jgi:hypothetical protein
MKFSFTFSSSLHWSQATFRYLYEYEFCFCLHCRSFIISHHLRRLHIVFNIFLRHFLHFIYRYIYIFCILVIVTRSRGCRDSCRALVVKMPSSQRCCSLKLNQYLSEIFNSYVAFKLCCLQRKNSTFFSRHSSCFRHQCHFDCTLFYVTTFLLFHQQQHQQHVFHSRDL